MTKHTFTVFSTLVVVSLSCSLPVAVNSTPIPVSISTPGGCISPEPAQSDIQRALSFAEREVDPAEWERSYSVSEKRVAVTWSNIPLGAILYVEALIFPCGYTGMDLDGYFSEENWTIILSNYETTQLTEECRAGASRLYHFNAYNQGLDYRIRFWARPDTDTRVLTAMLVFPVGAMERLDEYSSRLFPDLPACP